MDKQKCLDLHDELTQTQTRFQIFVIKSRVEVSISIATIQEQVEKLKIVEQINKKQKQTSDIFLYSKELINLKQQFQNYLQAKHIQSSAYQKIDTIANLIEEVAQNFQKLCVNFFDQDKCKSIVENNFNPLHQMMRLFKETCQRIIQVNHFKQSEQDQINEIINTYIKQNTNMFIEKSQEQEFYKNIDISYSHLIYLKKELVLNIEDVIDFIEDKVKFGVEIKNSQSVEEYLMQNGINIKNTRNNIEKRKENLKTLSSMKGQKNKDTLDYLIQEIKNDESQVDVCLQIVQIMMMMRKQVLDKLTEFYTFPPSFNIAEGQEISTLVQTIGGIKDIVEEQLDNFEDPLILPDGTLPTEGNEFSDDRVVRFSVYDGYTQQELERENAKIIKDDKKPVEFRLQQMKKSVTRSMKIVCNLLDYMFKQIKQHQAYEATFAEIQNQIYLLENNGRTQFLEFYDFIVQQKANFDQFCISLLKYIPPQLKFLTNMITVIKDKYINHINEIITKKYTKSNFISIGRIAKNINGPFDLNSLIKFLRDTLDQKYKNDPDQIAEQIKNVRDSFLFIQGKLTGMEDILDQIHKVVGNQQTIQSINQIGQIFGEIAQEDEMYFWQRLCSQVNEFYQSYEDIKKKKIVVPDDQIEKIFLNKTNPLINKASGNMANIGKEICDNYKTLILADYLWFTQQFPLSSQPNYHPRSQVNS